MEDLFHVKHKLSLFFIVLLILLFRTSLVHSQFNFRLGGYFGINNSIMVNSNQTSEQRFFNFGINTVLLYTINNNETINNKPTYYRMGLGINIFPYHKLNAIIINIGLIPYDYQTSYNIVISFSGLYAGIGYDFYIRKVALHITWFSFKLGYRFMDQFLVGIDTSLSVTYFSDNSYNDLSVNFYFMYCI